MSVYNSLGTRAQTAVKGQLVRNRRYSDRTAARWAAKAGSVISARQRAKRAAA